MGSVGESTSFHVRPGTLMTMTRRGDGGASPLGEGRGRGDEDAEREEGEHRRDRGGAGWRLTRAPPPGACAR